MISHKNHGTYIFDIPDIRLLFSYSENSGTESPKKIHLKITTLNLL